MLSMIPAFKYHCYSRNIDDSISNTELFQIPKSPSITASGFESMDNTQLPSSSPGLTLPGSQQSEDSVTMATGAESKPKKKICTRKSACTKWIEAHRQCLRAEGFNV